MFLLKLKDQNKTVRAGLVPAQLKSEPISFWIDSSGGPKEHCNLSFLGVKPKYYLYGFLDEVSFYETESPAITFAKENCFDFLDKKINEEKQNKDGVFVGYFSYDLFQRENKRDVPYPDFFFAYYEKIEMLKPLGKLSYHHTVIPSHCHLSSNMTDSEYLDKVRQIKAEIKAGNVYQVNLTREYSIEVENAYELALYLKLREVSPNPYGCFFKTPFVSILSSSPEEFLFVKNGLIKTRPVKGTLSKGETNIDPKNQAENIMIVDLERNDLGRICEYGSIKANKLLVIESFKHLNHVVSTVEGKLKSGVRLKDIFGAVFPGGSITGAPKIAAMKLIDKFEPTKRNAYTGSFGYIRTDGTMNFNILIRTIFVCDNKITFNVGGGIVADSDPKGELEEIRLKAEGILAAVGLKGLC